MDKKLRTKIEALCHEHPDEVARVLLESFFWPKDLAPMTHYARYDDDTYQGTIVVLFSNDSDAWFEVISIMDTDDPFTHRFRMPFYGGGQSARVRAALLLLALAIKLDNEEHPQHRPPRSSDD